MSSFDKEIEAIAQEIKRRAEEKVKQIIEEAEREAEQIIKEAEEKADRVFRHEAQSRLMIIRRRIIGAAEQEARRQLVEERNKVVNRVLEEAFRKLEDIVKGKDPKYKYEEILYSLIREAVLNIGESKVVLKVNERDKKYLLEKLSEIEARVRQETGINVELVVSDETINALGGVIAYNRDGTKIFYNTLEGRLRDKFERNKPIIAKILFSELSTKTT